MNTEITSNTQYRPVTVDVPEDRLAEFHAFFARFLSGERGRGRGGRRHGHGHEHRHGSRCGERGESSQASEPIAAPTEA
ncbi:MAG: hypothetical protein ABSF58_05910 [Solirubrobacteraceae bacterium]|jgi:hypothetical protein